VRLAKDGNMPIGDPNTWLEGATALKAAFDAFRAAVGLVRDTRKALGGDSAQTKAVDEALDHAVRTAAIAEAEIAKAFGYELCKCEFPPTIMVTVGFKSDRGPGQSGPVYECPECGFTNAGPWAYTRIVPKLPDDPKRIKF
jgi:hypothetical protein